MKRLREMLRTLGERAGENVGTTAALFGLNFFTIAWQNIHMYGSSQLPVLLWDFIFVLAGTVLAVLLVGALPWQRGRTVILRVAVGISALLAAFECFAIYNYQSLVGAGIITAILQTNPAEAGEFFTMYVGWRGVAVLVLCTVVAALLVRYRQRMPKLPAIGMPALRGGALIVLLIAGGISGGVIWRDFHSFVVNDMLDIPIVRIVRSCERAVRNIRAFEELAAKSASSVELTVNDSDVPYVVLILGESTNRDRMHLYGYPLENTPNLEDLAAKGELAVYRDTISPQGATVAALRELFTFHDVESTGEWYEYNNLIDVMKSAGYKTYWLSNQESSGIWGNVAQLFAGRSDVRRFTQLRESHEDSGRLDEELFPLFDEALASSGTKNFYVLHLMGGHGLYYMRFPYIFTKFTAADVPAPQDTYSETKRTEIAQYENALFYNDWVVSSLIGKLYDREAIVIYLPDHGETVYDGGSSLAGHVEENPDRHQLEIPFVIWGSASYRARHPEKWQAICASVNRPYMTDDLIHTIMDIVGLQSPEYDPTKSVINPAFDVTRARIVQGRNYDTDLRHKN